MKDNLPALLDSDQVAFQLNLSPRTIELRSQAGQIPGYVRIFGRHPRWKRDVIMQWIADGCPDYQNAQGTDMTQSSNAPIDETAFMTVHSTDDLTN